jgi:hypothetical protein
VAFPVWTPDGQVVVGWFTDSRFGVYTPDGSVALRRLTSGPRPRVPSDVSPDGRLLAFVEVFTPTRSDIWVVPLDGSRAPSLSFAIQATIYNRSSRRTADGSHTCQT